MTQRTTGQPNENPNRASRDRSRDDRTRPARTHGARPDVWLNVPFLKVDEIDLDVDDLRAQVALSAEVLDLLKLNVGVDASLGRVTLNIKGAEAEALLKVRLDNLAAIINRVLTTLDRNPDMLMHLARGVEVAAQDAVASAGSAVENVGVEGGRAGREIGSGAREAIEDLGDRAGRRTGEIRSGNKDTNRRPRRRREAARSETSTEPDPVHRSRRPRRRPNGNA